MGLRLLCYSSQSGARCTGIDLRCHTTSINYIDDRENYTILTNYIDRET